MRAEEILRKRKDRAIAMILNVKEREVDALLGDEAGGPRASSLLRKAILDQLNDFCEMAIDVARSGEAASYEFNPELWDAKINDIHRAVMAGVNGNGRH